MFAEKRDSSQFWTIYVIQTENFDFETAYLPENW